MKTLWLLQIGVQIALLLKLWRTRLVRPYRMFTCWLAWEVLRSLVLLAAGDAAYRSIWLSSAPFSMLLQFATLVEFAHQTLADYPGIAKFAPRLLITVSGLAIALVVLSAAPDLSLLKSHGSLLIAQRYLATALALVTGALMVFFAVVAPAASRRPNIQVHGCLLTGYHFSVALLYGLHNAHNARDRDSVNLGLTLVGSACLVLWTVLLRAAGEVTPVVVSEGSALGSPRQKLEEVVKAAERVWKG